jgi:DNA mismatch endonuclease (patch repair protein)
MSRIRGKNTKPEILVRKGLHARGFRFRLHNKKLPGSPDIVLPKYGVAIMVNGCFWHGHKGCQYATKPKSNIEFWETKIARNRHRDEVTSAHLEALGWHVITIWECELKGKSTATSRLDALAEEIREAGIALLERKALSKNNRLAAQSKARELMERQAQLDAFDQVFLGRPSGGKPLRQPAQGQGSYGYSHRLQDGHGGKERGTGHP